MDTPLEVNVKYHSKEGDLFDPTVFRQLMGSLNYLTITRSYIFFAIQQFSKFTHASRHLHLATICHIIRYLCGSSEHGLFFPTSYHLRLVAYNDADWTDLFFDLFKE